MLSQIAAWAGAVLAAGVIFGLVALAAAAAGVWWLYRTLRRRVEAVTASTARLALQGAVIAAAAGRVRLPPRVVHDLRQRIGGPPDLR
jgi:predicted membrane-bound spermidine synthase